MLDTSRSVAPPELVKEKLAMQIDLTKYPTLEKRFWAKVDKTPGHGPWGDCWIWTAFTNEKGYGKINPGGAGLSPLRAHRVSYVFAYGPIEDAIKVLHRCDNPPCVRPAHLFIGTVADNQRDMVLKGRGSKGERHRARMQRGERHHNAKLTEGKVRDIRRRRSAGATYNELIKDFHVSKSVIACVVNRKTWTHI